MKPIAEQLGQLTRLEELAGQNSPIHRLHPGAKLAATGVYLLCVLSLGRLQFGRLAPYLLYPVVVLSLAEVPLGLVLRRAALALPFCAFAGLSNLLLERQVLLWLTPPPRRLRRLLPTPPALTRTSDGYPIPQESRASLWTAFSKE